MPSVTLKDIALEVGFSVDTVSRVLNGKNKEVWSGAASRAAEIRRVAQRLNYLPSAAGRAMRSKGTQHVGVLLMNDTPRRYHFLDAFEMILGIEERLAKDGYVTSVIRVCDVSNVGGESRAFRERVLDGLIALGNHSVSLANQLSDLRLPVIWLDCNVWQPTGCIRLDDVSTGRAAASALWKTDGTAEAQLGLRKLIFLTMRPGSRPHHSEVERSASVEQFAKKNNLPFERVELFESSEDPETAAPAMPARLADLLSSSAPGELGIVAYNSLHARWLAHAAARLHRIPGVHFGLSCCDDNREVCVTWPDLSRMSVNRLNLGEMAAEMLFTSLRTPNTPAPSRTVAGQWISGSTSESKSAAVV